MDPAVFEQLLTPAGAAALAAAAALAPTDARYPACFDRLRKHHPAELARAALDTVMLRKKARPKFAAAEQMFFTREALEVASGDLAAAHRATRFVGFDTVADLCCGVGADAVALAAASRQVVAVDRDPLRLRMAEANLAAFGLTGTFVLADVLTADLPPFDAAFADPNRRPGGRRTLSLADCEPPVPALLARLAPRRLGLVGVKVAPGVPADEWRRFAGGVEFVSAGGELKECVLWSGPAAPPGVRATVLPGSHTLTADPSAAVDVGPPLGWVYDPDPAVRRSGLAATLAASLGGRLLDADGPLVTADAHTTTPFAAAYRVEEVLPFHAKRVGEWLRERGVGRVTVVKRGSDADADALVKRWKLRGDGYRAVILTRCQGEAVALIGERAGGG